MAYLPSTVSKLDPVKVRERTEHYIRVNSLRAEIHDVVAKALKPFDGKQPTKRMANAVEKAITEGFTSQKFSVHWCTDYSWYEIRIWNSTTLPWADNYSTTLGYKSDGNFNYQQWMDKTAQYHPASHARKGTLALSTLNERVAIYNDAIEALEQAYAGLNGLVTTS